MPEPQYFIGLDLGTSGARAVIIDAAAQPLAEAKAPMSHSAFAPNDPRAWWDVASVALGDVLSQIDRRFVAALCVDGTSGTVVGVDRTLAPVTQAYMYNDPIDDPDILSRINSGVPLDCAARGANSGLARAMMLARQSPFKILHQADWIAAQFTGKCVSDANNALKSGYDVHAGCWPQWITNLGLDPTVFPDVFEPGAIVGTLTEEAAKRFDLPLSCVVIAGTTDGCASFLATGAQHSGDAVTALGSTLTIKLLSQTPICAPKYGVYSHRILGKWLVGGASNTGGAVLAAFFDTEVLAQLSMKIDPAQNHDLGYYPLLKPGERFPVNDPDLLPRLTPRPKDDVAFLAGMFDAIAGIEKSCYDLLSRLGAPDVKCVYSVGGGANNAIWTDIRRCKLNVSFHSPAHHEAAFGSALLARIGATS